MNTAFIPNQKIVPMWRLALVVAGGLGFSVVAATAEVQPLPGISLHHDVVLVGAQVMESHVDNLRNPIAFNTSSLPGGTPVIVSAELDHALTEVQQALLTDYSVAKETAVRCKTVQVINLGADAAGRPALVARAQGCTLEKLASGKRSSAGPAGSKGI